MTSLLKKLHLIPLLCLIPFLFWFNADKEIKLDDTLIWWMEQTLISITFLYISTILYLEESKIKSWIIIVVQSVLLIGWIGLAFKNYLVFNGDNFHYIISGQSILDSGVMLDTHKLGAPRSTIIPPFLPYIIAGVFSLFGENFSVIKMVISLLYLGSAFIFYDLMNSFLTNKKIVAILTIVAFSSPFLIHATSMIMTEIPFIFTSTFVFWLTNKLDKHTKFDVKLIYLSITLAFLCLMTYLSRFIGICVIPTILLYFFREISFKSNLKTILLSFQAKRFILVFCLLGITFGGRMIYESQTSNSDKSSELFSHKSQNQFFKNLDAQIVILPSLVDQNIMFRKYSNFKYDLDIVKHNKDKFVIYSIILLGFIILIYFNNIFSYYLIFGFLILTIGSKVNDHLAILRYMSVFIPFVLYLLIVALNFIVEKMMPIFLSKKNKSLALSPLFSVVLLLGLFTNNILGMGYLVKLEQEKTENNKPYHDSQSNFFELAKWCRDKLPKDQYVMSRKPRMFTVYSQVPSCGIHAKKGNNKLNIKKEMQRLKEKKVKYIVIDTFSNLAHGLMVPLINANNSHFKKIKEFGKESPAYLFEVIY